MKIKKKIAYIAISILSIAMIISISGFTISSGNDKQNINYFNNVEITSEIDETRVDIDPTIAASEDFLLNNNNAISLDEQSDAITSLSITNGPRGYLNQARSNSIVYTAYDGNTIWTTNLNNAADRLVSSYYDTKGFFVCLIGFSDGNSVVYTFREVDGNRMDPGMLYIPNMKKSAIAADSSKRTLMVPIKGSNIRYLITYQEKNIDVQSNSIMRNYWIVEIDSSGTITINEGLISDTGTYSVFAIGSISINSENYLFLLCLYDNSNIYLRLIKNYQFIGEQLILNSYADTSPAIVDYNIPEIHLTTGTLNSDPASEPVIHIVTILNAISSQTKIGAGWLRLSDNTFNQFDERSINLQQNDVLDYDFAKGRIYGNYLYAYLQFANYGNGNKTNKIIRLKLSNAFDSDWNTEGLKWNENYNNTRIILYDSPFPFTNSNEPYFVIPIPFYEIDYFHRPNIAIRYVANNDLYLIDGIKQAYAYQTRSKATDNQVHIVSASDILVSEANSDLKTYFSDVIFAKNFTQYQALSSWSITKKMDQISVVENNKGNIPVSVEIDKAYNNNSFDIQTQPPSTTITRTFDIVLTGFKAVSTSLQQPTNNIGLPDQYPYQMGDLDKNDIIKDFLFNNVVTGLKDDLMNKDDISIRSSDVTYDNKDGSILLKSITLKNWYNDQGILQTTPKNFILTDSNPIKITGFKKVAGPTAGKQGPIGIIGDLATMNTTQVTDVQLTKWINDNINLVLDNPAPNTTVTISNLQAESSTGIINLDVSPDAYFINDFFYDNLYSYTLTTNISISFRIKLTGFALLDQTTRVVANDATIANVSGTLADLLPQAINENKENDDFKKYLVENIVIDPSKHLNPVVTDFSGTYNNVTGTYTLNSLTLANTLDENGKDIGAITFSNLSISIKGFKAISITKTIDTPLTISSFATTSILDATNEMIKAWLDTNFTQAFVANSLPTNFSKTNLVSVEIINDSIVASTGSLKVNIVVNNYYANDTIGTLTTADSSPFELTITGFKTDSLATSVNIDPTAVAPLPETLKNVLAENVDFANDQNGFKDYLFKHVLVDPSNALTIANITNISDIVANNINGTLSFKLEVNKRTDQDGKLIDGPYTFNEVITIKGFKQISSTTTITTSLAKGDSTVLANDVTPEQYTKVIKDNYKDILTNLPEGFDPATNISVNKASANNEQGTLDVNVVINLYYIETTGLITTNPTKTFTITISGYKSSLISINNRVDVNNVSSTYHNRIAGSSLIDGTNTDLQIATNWLRIDDVFTKVIADPKGLAKTAFSVATINTIDNLAGAITVKLAVTGGNFAPNNNQLTFFGFRRAININQWTDQIKNMTGSATNLTDQIKNIKDQIVELSKSSDSPFNQPLDPNNIQIVDAGNNNFNITITPSSNNGYIKADGNYDDTSTSIIFDIRYQIDTSSNSQSRLQYWVYPVIFSIVGLTVFLILLTIVIIIIRRNKKQTDLLDDYGMDI